jgi:hypothetical protein
MYWLVINGQKSPIRTRISHGEREANDYLQNHIRKQLKLSADEFARFVDCPMNKDQYAALMIQRGEAVAKPSRSEGQSA